MGPCGLFILECLSTLFGSKIVLQFLKTVLSTLIVNGDYFLRTLSTMINVLSFSQGR